MVAAIVRTRDRRHGAQERHRARRQIGTGRTRPNGGNATAGGCGAFGANLSAAQERHGGRLLSEPVATVAADCRHGCPVRTLDRSQTCHRRRMVEAGRGEPVGRLSERRDAANPSARLPARTRDRRQTIRTAGRTANGCPVATVAGLSPRLPCRRDGCGRLSEPNHATAHRNGTGRGGESGRARTRPNP